MVQSILCYMTDEQTQTKILSSQADPVSWSLLAQNKLFNHVMLRYSLVPVVCNPLCFISFQFWTIFFLY